MKENKKNIILFSVMIILICGLIVSNIITIKMYLNVIHKEEQQIISETGEEISRVKYFIKDWFNELSHSYGEVEVFHNELRFKNGTYTLTVAADRIRAVYPRGIRNFQLVYVRYIDFYKDVDNIRCRVYYNDSGTLEFLVK